MALESRRADYREKLRELKEQLERVDAAPDERRIDDGDQDGAGSRGRLGTGTPERWKQLVAELFETVRVGGGRIVSVGDIERYTANDRAQDSPDTWTHGTTRHAADGC